MLNLAIECSGIGGSVALCERDRPLAVRSLPENLGSVQTLAVTVASIVAGAGHVGLLSVTSGPGSFTGLRVGLATAKLLALAWEVPIAAVDSLAVIAQQQRLRLDAAEPPEDEPVAVVSVLNAFRNQVFAAVWRWEPGGLWQPWAKSQVVDAKRWQEEPIRSVHGNSEEKLGDCQVVLTGSGLQLFRPEPMPTYAVAHQDDWSPAAENLGRLGWRLFQEGRTQSAAELVPNYVRASAAEEKAGVKSTSS